MIYDPRNPEDQKTVAEYFSLMARSAAQVDRRLTEKDCPVILVDYLLERTQYLSARVAMLEASREVDLTDKQS